MNMKNEDEKWWNTRALNPVEKDPQNITAKLRKQSEKLNWREFHFQLRSR